MKYGKRVGPQTIKSTLSRYLIYIAVSSCLGPLIIIIKIGSWYLFVSSFIIRKILTIALMALVNNLFLKSFDITFMGNKKNCQNINCFFFLFQWKLYLTGLLTNTLKTLVSITLIIIGLLCTYYWVKIDWLWLINSIIQVD